MRECKVNATKFHDDCLLTHKDIYRVLRSKHKGIKSETGHYTGSESRNITRKIGQTKDTMVWACVTHGQYDSFKSLKSKRFSLKDYWEHQE
jgi:hypothetical protein